MHGLADRFTPAHGASCAAVTRPGLRPRQRAALSGLRVLVLEDSFLVAEVIAETLEAGGCDVVGPVSRVDSALPIARDEPLDGAVLDVNLAGEFSFPVADTLAERGVPFLFVTGYSDLEVLPSRFRKAPMMHKPFAPDELAELTSARFRRTA